MNRIADGATIIALALALLLSSGCAVLAVTDAVVTTAAVVVKTGVKVSGAVIGAVIPDSDDSD